MAPKSPTTHSEASARDPLLQPFQIKGLTLKNRVMSTSHACGLEVDGMPVGRYQLYHEAKAKGGIALTMFGGSSNVAPDSPNIFRQLNVGTDAVIPYLQKFSERGPQPAAKPALTTAAMALAPFSTRRRPGIDPWVVEANAICSSELLVSSLSSLRVLRAGKGTRLRELRRVFPSSCRQHERQVSGGFVLS